jgi:hypothetical protein
VPLAPPRSEPKRENRRRRGRDCDYGQPDDAHRIRDQDGRRVAEGQIDCAVSRAAFPQAPRTDAGRREEKRSAEGEDRPAPSLPLVVPQEPEENECEHGTIQGESSCAQSRPVLQAERDRKPARGQQDRRRESDDWAMHEPAQDSDQVEVEPLPPAPLVPVLWSLGNARARPERRSTDGGKSEEEADECSEEGAERAGKAA